VRLSDTVKYIYLLTDAYAPVGIYSSYTRNDYKYAPRYNGIKMPHRRFRSRGKGKSGQFTVYWKTLFISSNIQVTVSTYIFRKYVHLNV